MESFTDIYKILHGLESCMDMETVNRDMISPEMLKISKDRWEKYLEMLQDEGYIKGVKISTYISGAKVVNADNIQITLKGLEYLNENSVMKKAENLIMGITGKIG